MGSVKNMFLEIKWIIKRTECGKVGNFYLGNLKLNAYETYKWRIEMSSRSLAK